MTKLMEGVMNVLGHEIGNGCTNHSCLVYRIPKGHMGTNGQCSCLPPSLPSEVRLKIRRELYRLGYPKERQ